MKYCNNINQVPVKGNKNMSYNFKNDYLDFKNLYGEIEGDWLRKQVDEWWKKEYESDYDYGNTDSFRVAIKGDVIRNHEVISCEEEKRYIDAMTCCGFCDIEFGPSPNNKIYKYGFNHGH
jgi:hypothetical protein